MNTNNLACHKCMSPIFMLLQEEGSLKVDVMCSQCGTLFLTHTRTLHPETSPPGESSKPTNVLEGVVFFPPEVIEESGKLT